MHNFQMIDKEWADRVVAAFRAAAELAEERAAINRLRTFTRSFWGACWAWLRNDLT